MARMVPVNAEFDAELSQMGSADELASLRHGIEAALAVAPGDTLNTTDYPILGYYFTTAADHFLAYFITPGRFVRYEIASGRSLTVTVSTDRISRVVEQAAADSLSVTVELDADALSAVFEAQTNAAPPGAVGQVSGLARVNRTVYELAATDLTTVMRLAAFSRALRSAVGL